MKAVNNAWAILREPKSRGEYNQKIISAAIAEESKANSRKAHAQIAKMQKAPEPKPRAKAKASKETASTPSSSKHVGSTSSSSKKEDSKTAWVFCRLYEQKTAAVCKSMVSKSITRRFEHKPWAGEQHAVCVAKEFQAACESMVAKSMAIVSLKDLKQFCEDYGIELPSGVRLNKVLLLDHIEEARIDQFQFFSNPKTKIKGIGSTKRTFLSFVSSKKHASILKIVRANSCGPKQHKPVIYC